MRRFIAALFAFALVATPAQAAPPIFNGDLISSTTPAFNATAYGAKCNGSTDDTGAIQAAITAAGQKGGGKVLLPYGTCMVNSLTVPYNDVFIEGHGSAMDSSSPATSLKYNGTAGGTLITFAASTIAISGGGMGNLMLDSNGGLGANAVITKAAQFLRFWNLNYNGFTANAFWLTYNASASIPGSFGITMDKISGNNSTTTGNGIWLDGSYNDVFNNVFLSCGSGDCIKIGDGTTAYDESDTNSFFHFVMNQTASATGYVVEMSCDAFRNYFYSFDPGGSTASHAVMVRGTSTCASRNGASTGNIIYGYAPAAIMPTVETGGGLSYTQSNGVSVFPSGAYHSYNSNIPAFFGTTTGNPYSFYGQLNSDNTPILFGNTTGANGATRIGSASGSTCGTITANVFAVINVGSANCLAFDNAGDLGISKNFYGTNISDGGGAYGVTGNAYKVSFGNLNTVTDLYSYGCAANAAHPCILLSGGDTVNGVTATAFEVGIQGTAALLGIDAIGNTSVKGAISGGGHNTCSASSGVPCLATMSCALSAATTCNATVTVPASSNCIATPNASDTMTAVEQFKTSLSSTTLTVTELATASQTATAAANVHCL